MSTSTPASKDRAPQIKTSTRPKKASIFFSEDELGKMYTKGMNTSTISLHDQGLIEQIGEILNNVFDEVRNDFRISCIHKGLIEVKDLAPPLIFQSSTAQEWILTYYRKYAKMDTPDCFIPGTEPLEPKIDRRFHYYHRIGTFNSPIKVGKLLTKCHQYCGIVLASNYGNRKNWLLNPPK